MYPSICIYTYIYIIYIYTYHIYIHIIYIYISYIYIYIHTHIHTYIYIHTYTDIHSVSSNVRFTVCTPLRRWMSPSLPIGEGLAGESAGVEPWPVPTALFFFGENDGNKYGI